MEIERVHVERIVPLRHVVLRPGLERATARFDGDTHPDTIHLAAVASGTVIGCVTCMPRELGDAPAWQLRGMAVTEGRRGRGIGTALLAAVGKAVAASSMPAPLWCNAREPAVPFYRGRGWRVVSGRFEIPTVGPHYRMVREPDRPASPE